MPRHRLGVVLLVPEPVRTHVEGVQIGLGGDRRVPPHITLVAPISVEAADLDIAIGVVREAAAAEPRAVNVSIGPSRTFLPINPVVYLAVNGDVDAVSRLHDACRRGPLERPDEYEFTPHVTLIDGGDDAFLAAAQTASASFTAAFTVHEATVLQFGEDSVWRPIADAPFGDNATSTRMFGADRVTIRVGAYPTVAASDIGRYRPLVVEAFVDGVTVGVARGRIADEDVAWLDELVIVGESRGTGIGGTLARAFIEAARTGKATEVRAARGATIAGFLVRIGFVAEEANEFVLAL